MDRLRNWQHSSESNVNKNKQLLKKVAGAGAKLIKNELLLKTSFIMHFYTGSDPYTVKIYLKFQTFELKFFAFASASFGPKFFLSVISIGEQLLSFF